MYFYDLSSHDSYFVMLIVLVVGPGRFILNGSFLARVNDPSSRVCTDHK